MTDKQKKWFEKYTDCVREHQTSTDCLIFQNGFRLGASIMLEIMEESLVKQTWIAFMVTQVCFLKQRKSKHFIRRKKCNHFSETRCIF